MSNIRRKGKKHKPFCDDTAKHSFGHLCDSCLNSLKCGRNDGITIVLKCDRYRKRGDKRVPM